MSRFQAGQQVWNDPIASYREGWNEFVKAFIKAMADGHDDELPVMYRTGRFVLADSLAQDDQFQQRYEEIRKDERFDRLGEAWSKDPNSGARIMQKDPREKAEHERMWAWLEEMQRVAVRRGLWGAKPVPESEESMEYLKGFAEA